MKKPFFAAALLAALPSSALAAGPVDVGDAPRLTLADVVSVSPDHRVLDLALRYTGLDAALRAPGALTLFAPTDAAFANVPQSYLNVLSRDPQLLADVLTYHVLPGKLLSGAVVTSPGAGTLFGPPVAFSVQGSNVLADSANISIVDFETSNGVLHIIDDILVPFLPNVPGAKPDIVSVLIEDGRFTTLVQAVQAAGLVSALQQQGPYTLFAPTDEAFARIPAVTLEDLIESPEILAQILLYHVTPELVFGARVASQSEAITLQGGIIDFNEIGGELFVNEAMVVAPADLVVGNGVIHAIDRVLLP